MAARKQLNGLLQREGLDNKSCIDCRNPNPQWASLSFAVFLCLQCAGTHRGYGVHISFVRSVSMDAWQDDQLQRMELGGNAPFREFIKSYDASGGYKEGASSYETYHCWAATQYKEKLNALLAGKDWSPSPPPANFNSTSRSASPSPAATQGLRKSRAHNTRLNTTRSESPSSPNLGSNSSPPSVLDTKSQNETYFANLGTLNASRSADLPPSQGGRYQGFGNTPTPPSFALSSANASTLQDSPMAALSKGWSIFSSAVVGASKVVNDTVIQPGMEKISDPSFQSNLKGYVDEAGKRATGVGSSANQWSKNRFGIDVVDSVYGVKERVLGGPARSGYGQVALHAENESSALYDAGDDDDLFGEYSQGKTYDPSPDNWVGSNNNTNSTGESTPAAGNDHVATRQQTGSVTSRAKPPAKKEDEWDDWKDF